MSDHLQLFPADEALKPLIEQIAVGTNDDLIKQLVANSRQEAMLRFTPKDAGERFKDEAAFHMWQTKGRTVHWLLAKDHKLAGIIWYGTSTCPTPVKADFSPDETFAIRIYEGFNGHGLARPFMQQSLRLHIQAKQALNQPINGIWLETDDDNPAAVAAYTKFGYEEVAHDGKRVTMILSPQKMLAVAQA